MGVRDLFWLDNSSFLITGYEVWRCVCVCVCDLVGLKALLLGMGHGSFPKLGYPNIDPNIL